MHEIEKSIIVEQAPDRRVAWRSMSGVKNSGMVNFEAVDPNRTRIRLKLNYDPEEAVEEIGFALGVLSARVAADLHRLKKLIEGRGTESGAWRGETRGREMRP